MYCVCLRMLTCQQLCLHMQLVAQKHWHIFLSSCPTSKHSHTRFHRRCAYDNEERQVCHFSFSKPSQLDVLLRVSNVKTFMYVNHCTRFSLLQCRTSAAFSQTPKLAMNCVPLVTKIGNCRYCQ